MVIRRTRWGGAAAYCAEARRKLSLFVLTKETAAIPINAAPTK